MAVRLLVNVARAPEDQPLFRVPFDIYSEDGDLIAEGVTGAGSTSFDLSVELNAKVFVRSRLPNGSTSQVTVTFTQPEMAAWLFADVQSPHEWMQWATPFRDLRHLAPGSANAPSLQGTIWATLWELSNGRWSSHPLEAVQAHGDRNLQLYELAVPARPHLLHVGGAAMASRLVSLPPGHQVRIALAATPDSAAERADVVISRSQPDFDLVMSLLARGQLREAAQLGAELRLAEQLFDNAIADTLSSLIAGYYVVRAAPLEERQRLPERALARWPSYLPDTHIVTAAWHLQLAKPDVEAASTAILRMFESGVPLFTSGLGLAVETLELLSNGKNSRAALLKEVLRAARTYQAAQATRGAYLSFFGLSPTQPTMEHIMSPVARQTQAGPSPAGAPQVEPAPSVESPRSEDQPSIQSATPTILYGPPHRRFFPWVVFAGGVAAVLVALGYFAFPVSEPLQVPGVDTASNINFLTHPLIWVPLLVGCLIYFRVHEKRDRLERRLMEAALRKVLGPAADVALYKGSKTGLPVAPMPTQATLLNATPVAADTRREDA